MTGIFNILIVILYMYQYIYTVSFKLMNHNLFLRNPNPNKRQFTYQAFIYRTYKFKKWFKISFYLKDTDRNRAIFHLLVYSPKAHNRQSWARPGQAPGTPLGLPCGQQSLNYHLSFLRVPISRMLDGKCSGNQIQAL